ncbi:YrrC family ATP-dependent DNA helicase, partial [Limosilactobacillus reuteri]
MAEIEIVGSIQRIRFAANDSLFKIATMRVSEVREGNIVKNSFGDVVFKGEMSLIPQNEYIIRGEFINDEKYGPQYQYISSKRRDPIEGMSREDFRQFLTDISPKGVLVNAQFDDPRPIFQEHRVKELMAIKGIGPVSADKLINAYEEQKDYS